jgi:hypothetical protein
MHHRVCGAGLILAVSTVTAFAQPARKAPPRDAPDDLEPAEPEPEPASSDV